MLAFSRAKLERSLAVCRFPQYPKPLRGRGGAVLRVVRSAPVSFVQIDVTGGVVPEILRRTLYTPIFHIDTNLINSRGKLEGDEPA